MAQLSDQLTAVHTRLRQYSQFPVIKRSDITGDSVGTKGSLEEEEEVLLGSGGFADVFLAVADDGETVAVKRMKRGLPFGRQFLAVADRWAAELLVACDADHPHVMGCYAWGIEMQQSPGGGKNLYRMRMALPRMVERWDRGEV